MSDYWIAVTIGAGSGAALLALFSLLPHKVIVQQGFIIFAVMLWIYVGVRLGNGPMEAIVYEALFALIPCGIVQFAVLRWPPLIGIAIFMHGAYDAIIGPHTGVPIGIRPSARDSTWWLVWDC